MKNMVKHHPYTCIIFFLNEHEFGHRGEATVWWLGVKPLLTCLPCLDPFSAPLVS